jgi:hypothetical protein
MQSPQPEWLLAAVRLDSVQDPQTPPVANLPGNQPTSPNQTTGQKTPVDSQQSKGSGSSQPTPENSTDQGESPKQDTAPDDSASTAAPKPEAPSSDSSNFMMIVFGIALTALCWGAYGPILHAGQAAMGQSRFRPFLCVGLAYFALAVVIPVLISPQFPEPGGWSNVGGIVWSLLGGAAGAGGALGIIYAFNSGGKPVYVMPLVFGFAPVVNTFTEITTKKLFDQIPTPFYISLLLVILGAVTVLVCAPKGHAKPAPPPPAT